MEPDRQADVVFARSLLRRGVPGFWEKAHKAFGKRAKFVGLPQEHADYVQHVGPIERLATSGMLEVARIIAGADPFVGDQSAPRAVAEGLKKLVILEVGEAATCCFGRPGELDIRAPADLRLIGKHARR